ncbi:syncoilin isoform X2 [Austrofundulus limnaeus]|nr:PREDICTED: syncoilin-like isoform X2 [Austrofundulus limnaeus]
MSSTGLKPLFIREEEEDLDRTTVEQREDNENPSGLSFTGSPLKQSALIKPYLQEMDELLKSCEELTGVPFGSCRSVGDSEAFLKESSSDEEVRTENHTPPQAYLCTGYIDTHVDVTETQDETTQGQCLDNFVNGCEFYQHMELPLSSAGSKLRANMVEYEGQLRKTLAMLESCMEESQDWAADTGQEYVHISKIPDHYKDTTHETLKPKSPRELKTPPVNSETRDRSESLQKSLICCEETIGGFLRKRPEKPEEHGSGSQVGNTEQDPVLNERTQTRCMFEESTNTKRHEEDDELPSEDGHEFNTDLGSDVDKFKALRPRMEDCIEKVQQMQKRRKELLVEVLQLRDEGGTEEEEESAEWIHSRVVELMDTLRREEEVRRGERKREINGLREEMAEEERKLWKLNLERQNLQEELRRLKRRLFAVARDCAYSRAALNNQRGEVESLKREEDKLNSVMLQLIEESSQIRSAQQQQLSDLQAQLHFRSSSRTSGTQELSECRRHSSCDIQQYLQGERKALEDRYEPVLLALLKRREATAGALVNVKQQAQELRAQLRPLRDETQKLELRRACLDEKLQLITAQSREDVGRYKEAVCDLEECSRELKTELEIQKRKTKEMEELRENLTKQLLLHRAAAEERGQSLGKP